MALDRDLQELGLGSKEAAVYVALLELDAASVQAIARRANIVRPTTYVILESLERKGLVSKATGPDAKKMLFRAEEPVHLKQYLDQQRQELERRQENLDRIIPELRSAYGRGEERPRVRLFEGKEGLQALQQEFVQAGSGPVVGLTPRDELHGLFPEEEYNETIVRTRVQARVPSRRLYTTATSWRHTKEQDAAFLRESRFIPAEKLPIKASFAVNGPLLSIVSFRGKIIGVLIEHEDIANSFRVIFETVWEAAERYQTRPP